ncbi:MAG TPA: DUF2336 domain-containing protein [Xanthobacteraceae bacterium]|nr:DUF2336 domain-containing protein [Xanthobacteraceae bacterium]
MSLDGLADLGSRNEVDMRPTLLRVLTDLYVQKLRHTLDEERHYTELALRLLGAVDVPTRIEVSSKLARHLSPPRQVLQFLAGDVPEVAAPLRAHPLLQPSAPVGANAPLAALPLFAEDGKPDREGAFARAPRAVDAAMAGELNELFLAANANERRLILLNLEIVAPLPADSIGIVRDPSVGERLEAAALARNPADFARHLARSLQIPREQAARLVADDLGEPVIVAAKALRVPRDVLYRILLFVNPAVGNSVERVHALATLYDEITPRAAEGMIAIWRALPGADRAEVRYQPVTRDDEARPRARPASTAQRSPAGARTNDRRSAS